MIHLVQYPLNMSIAGLAEGDEEYPGMYLPLNDDDDNNNSIPDNQENSVIGEDDLVAVTIDAAAFLPGDTTLYLQETGATGKLKIWSSPTKGAGTEIDITGTGHAILNSNLPVTYYVEGYAATTSLESANMFLAYCFDDVYDGTDECICVSIGNECDIDIDVDSDNTNSTPPYGPDGSPNEDENEENSPGRYIIVNNDDDDGDGIPDYVDGFNIDGDPNTVDDNICAAEDDFVLMTFSIENLPGIPTNFIVDYNESDPGDASFVEPDQVGLPQDGGLRIWKYNGNIARDKSPMLDGDYLAKGDYAPGDHEILGQYFRPMYYIEGIKPGEYTIRFRIEYENDEGPGYCEDVVKVTVIGIDIIQPDNYQEFQYLYQPDYNSTGSINFQAKVLPENLNYIGDIEWEYFLEYETDGAGPFADERNMISINNQVIQQTYTCLGGKLKATASFVFNGLSCSDSIFCYITGNAIPDDTITQKLRYSNMYNPPAGGTEGLLTGIAMKESSYRQFFNSYIKYDYQARWPVENITTTPPRGSYIGLLQVKFCDQNNMSRAWDWNLNAETGASILNEKISIANNEVANKRSSHPGLPDLPDFNNSGANGDEYENYALSLYVGYATIRYYEPVETQEGWIWVLTSVQDLLDYVSIIRNNIRDL